MGLSVRESIEKAYKEMYETDEIKKQPKKKKDKISDEICPSVL